MTVEVTSRDTLDPTRCEGRFVDFVNDLNIAAAAGKAFVLAQEAGRGPVALETRNITRVRDLGEEEPSAYIGS